jgi:hypothetical protein
MWLRKWTAALLISVALCACASGQQLEWDANQDDGLTVGYKIYYGSASSQYSGNVDVGNVTEWPIPGDWPRDQDYYFAATAYSAVGQESGYSNEVVYYRDESGVPTAATDVQISFREVYPMPVIVSDAFGSDTSADYTALANGISISGGYAYGSVQYANCAVFHETTMGSPDHYVQAKIEYATASSAYLIFRHNGSNAGYAVTIVGSSLKLYKIEAGTLTFLDKYWTITATSGTLYTVKIVISGSNITAFLNGSQLMTTHNSTDGIISDSTYSAGNYIGIGWDRGAGYNPRIDDLEAGTSAAGGGVTMPLFLYHYMHH